MLEPVMVDGICWMLFIASSIISMVYEVKPIFFRGRVREALWRKLRDQYLNVEAEIEIER